MTKEKALSLALKIVSTCKKYGNEDRCTQCPFSMGGCIFDGETPIDWHISELPLILELHRKGNTHND